MKRKNRVSPFETIQTSSSSEPSSTSVCGNNFIESSNIALWNLLLFKVCKSSKLKMSSFLSTKDLLSFYLLSTMVQTLKYVYGNHGVRRGLYRGLSLNYIRCIPSQAVAFTTYELMKQFLHLN